MKRLYFAKYGYIIMSLLFYLVGLIYMFLPDLSPLLLCIVGGVCLLVYGAIKLVGYLSPDLYCLAFQYDMASAILLLVMGVVVIVFNVRLSDVLVPGLGFLVLMDSVLTIQMAKDAAKFGIRSWVLLLVVSIVAVLFSVLLIIHPFSGIRLRHVFVGLTILTEGFMKHCVMLCTVKAPDRKDRRKENHAPIQKAGAQGEAE